MEIIRIPIDELTPDPNNAKDHPAWQVEQIKNSIEQFGNLDPIGVWGDDNLIVEGHGRYEALKELGYHEAECIRLDQLTEEERKAYALTHNQLTMNSGWDEKALEQTLASISDIDMEQFGFKIEVPEAPTQEVPVPEVAEPRCKQGDIWNLGRHRLMCGDSTLVDAVEALVGGKSMDMLLTDPPYNVDYEGTAGKIMNDKMEDDKFRQFLADAFVNAKTVMKNGAAFHIWHADSEGYNFRGACIDAGFKVRQCLIWEKNALVLGRQDFQWMHEPCLYGENPPPEGQTDQYLDEENNVALYGWKDGSKHYWFKNRKQTTILRFDRPMVSKEHPTMKPIKLFDYQMQCNTKRGENVLDLFAGSGTTIMAAEQNGRNAFCMEFDPHYCDVIIKRWENFTGQEAVLTNGKT